MAAKVEDQLPDGITALDNQGGGHMFNAKKGMVGIMLDSDGRLLKPVCPDASVQEEDDEVRFYEKIANSADPVDRELAGLAPKYFGTRTVTVGEREVLCMKVENFTRGFRHACVLDIKVGRVTSIPTAPEHKRKHEASKYTGTRHTVGFSVPGMTVFDVSRGAVTQHGKEFGKGLNGDTVADAFRAFLNAPCGARVRPICDSLITQLESIHSWFSRQRKYQFFASSILLTYDAAGLLPGCGSPVLAAARPAARMIDFAHAWPAAGAADANYLEGLQHVLRLVRLVRETLPPA
ncbi:inositol polyphosphate multikinase alpha-like [Pollicipes pollicipes]|uniref:inositol polyphosphate multikinase alpha-like n=1 Tax=Pollicipes pollicipes TaxID=41117 RepID=UPI00188539D3|nr:inositol polyphosphate multikinase alpha-like [Pollicipes pollicipes]XP_037069174.1 inositol polyphosphate multikinase alpha-like [Pollicipes pollicipes]